MNKVNPQNVKKANIFTRFLWPTKQQKKTTTNKNSDELDCLVTSS